MTKLAAYLSIWLCLISATLLGQTTVELTALPTATADILSEEFKDFQTVELDFLQLYQMYLQAGDEVKFTLETSSKKQLDFRLAPYDLRGINYHRQTPNNGRIIRHAPVRNATFRGTMGDTNPQEAIWTFDEQYVLGRWEENGTVYFLEPLWRFDSEADRNHYLVYREQDAIMPENYCATHIPAQVERIQDKPDGPEKLGECLIVELALASDFELYQDFGSNETSVENFMLNNLANVQTNYDDEFADEIQFEVVTTFIATCNNASCDPWTNNTDAGTLLNDFTGWGNGGGFGGVTYDVATLWTGRNFNGGTIGVAWLSGLCGSLRYNTCENFSSNAQTLRVLWAHELGHNFGSGHDGSGGFIMSPSVNTSTTWSTQSQNAVNNLVSNVNCLSSCGLAEPPTAIIEVAYDEACTESFLAFFDESDGNVTERFWDFPGGNPDFSTDAHPIVYYDEPGIYTASLSVENVQGSDFTDYTFEVGLNENFRKVLHYTNFEDGFGGWFVENPDNETTWAIVDVEGNKGDQAAFVNNFDYDADGQLDAMISPFFDLTTAGEPKLSLEYAYARFNNGLRDQLRIYISTDGGDTFPDLLFEGDENGSGNFATTGDTNNAFFPQDFSEWCGTDPVCIEIDLDAYAGEGDVVIKIENVNGFGNNMFVDNIALTAFCGALDPPIADFIQDETIGCAPLVVEFEDRSEGIVEFREWTFPGGNPEFSNDEFPFSEYNIPGVYDVTLYVENNVGSDTHTEVGAVTVLGLPTPGFTFTNTGLTYQFMNTSSDDVEDFAWDFDDGSFSQDENPEHTFPGPGTYEVELEVFNQCGSDLIIQTIVVEAVLVADFTSDVTNGCADLTVQFTDTSVGDPDAWFWSFPGGTPASSSDPNPEVVYTMPGVYDVSLTVEGGGEVSDFVASNYITVLGLPSASFTASLDPGDASPTIVNNSTNADSYNWDFGNGEMSSLENPMVTYTEAGTYVITLTATNECGSVETTQTVEVIFPVDPEITASATSGCIPFAVEFLAAPQEDDQTYSWEFPGGDPAMSSSANPSVTYGMEGSYDVTLTITNAAGSTTVTETSLIVVNEAPTAAFNVTTTPGSLTIELDDLSVGGTSIVWDFGDGTITSDNLTSYTYDDEGTYTITQTVANECGTDEATETIELILPVDATIEADVTSGCVPLDVNFTASPIEDGQTYSWEFPGGDPASSTSATPMVTYALAGSYDVSLTITNAAGASTTIESAFIVVNEGPTAGFIASVTPGSLTVNLTDQSTNANTVSWDFGDGTITTDTPASYTYDEEGTYTITQTVSNECGTDIATQTVELVLPVDPVITASVTEGCSPLLVNFTAQPQDDSYTYSWNFVGGTPSSATTPEVAVIYNNPGTYSVELTITNGAGASTVTQEDLIVVGQGPIANFVVDNTPGSAVVNFTNNSAFTDEVEWFFGDGGESDELNPEYTYPTEGTYEVTLVASNECGTDTSRQTIDIIFVPEPSITASVSSGCAPLTVTYEAQPQGPGNTYQWDFPGGDPMTSTDAVVTVVYTEPGNYDASLTVTNAAGSGSTQTTSSIMVLQVPMVAFNIDYEIGSFSATFTSTSQGVNNLTWDFGDGNMDEGEVVTHTYAAAGNYEVSLTGTGPCGSETITQTIMVVVAPEGGFTETARTGCAPFTTTFMANDQGESFTYSWIFEGGMPEFSNDPNPTVVYDTPGTYSVSLGVTNAAGTETEIQEDYIVVGTAPNADFNIATTLGSLMITTTGPDDADITAWAWDFGDGTEATGMVADHTYMSSGTYIVQLTTTNACGTTTMEQTVTVLTTPVATFTASSLSVCIGETVTLMADEQGADFTYNWTINGGMPSTSDDATVMTSFATAGTYEVSLSVTNAAGTTTTQQMIVVNALPSAGFTFTVNGLTASFMNTSTNATIYEWGFPGGETSDEENPEFTFPGVGTYIVQLTARSDCGSSATSMTIVIEGEIPNIAFSSENSEGCAPLTVSFTSTTENADALMWSFPGGDPATSTDPNPVVTYAMAGTYDVTLSATNAFGTNSVTQQAAVTVLAPTTANFGFNLVETTAVFSNLSSEETSVLWTFPDGTTSTMDDPTYVFPGNGTYEVTLTATGPCNTDVTTQTIVIDGLLPAVNFVGDNTSGCAPLTVTLTDDSQNAPMSWNWTTPGGDPETSTGATVMVTYATAGIYPVTLEVTNVYGTSTLELMDYITVEEEPTEPAFTSSTDDDMTFAFTVDSPVAGWTYSWAFGDGDFADGTMVEHTYLANGPFEVSLVVTNECGSATSMAMVNPIISSVDTPAWAFDLTLSPNPTNGLLFLRASNWPASGNLDFRLVNALGQHLNQLQRQVGNGNWEQQIDLSNLPAGTYWLQISWANEVWTQKVIKL